MGEVKRKRNRSVTIRMNDSEYSDFKNKIKESGLTEQAYVIDAIRRAKVTSNDEIVVLKNISKAFSEYVKQIRGIATNINQMSRVANSQGFLPGRNTLNQLSKDISDIRKDGEQIWQLIRSSIHP